MPSRGGQPGVACAVRRLPRRRSGGPAFRFTVRESPSMRAWFNAQRIGMAALAAQLCTAVALIVCSTFATAQITVYSSGSITIGDSRQLTAYVPLAVNTVNWSVNGVPGGDSTYGTVSTTGLYKAPATVPSANAVRVQASSTANPAQFGAVTLTITQPPVQLWSISPTSVPLDQLSIRLNGSNFTASSVVNFGGIPLTTTFLSSTSLRAVGVANASQVGSSVPVTVTNPGLGGTTSPAVSLSITASKPVTVSVAPSSAALVTSATRQFSATVTGATNTSVTWSVNGIAGGNAAIGTISSSGLYTAPASAANLPGITIQAASVVNTSSTGTASVTVRPAPPMITVTLARASVVVKPSAAQQFTAGVVVSGSASTAVTWSVNAIAGGN